MLVVISLTGCGADDETVQSAAGSDAAADTVSDSGSAPDSDSETSAPPVVSVPDGATVVSLGSTVATVDARFLSFAIDTSQIVGGLFWTPGGGSRGGLGTEHVPPYDFSRPELRTWTQALSPAWLRIGGSEADVVLYDLSDDPVETAPAPYTNVLTRAQWDGVGQFAQDMGLSLMFTLNAGPGPRDPETRAWTDTNAREFVAYTVDKGYPVEVWELGNEINGYGLIHGAEWAIGGATYADDLAVARAMLNAEAPGSRLAGPSCAYWPIAGELGGLMPDLLAEGGEHLDIVTWHFYPQQSERCPFSTVLAEPEVMLNPAQLDEVATWASEVEALASEHAPSASVWLGESGNAQCGGQAGVSDVFAGTFWWMDQLGQMAQRGQPVVVRQTLSGSEYGLIDDETLVPRPDYWASVLFKRLMGTTVLDVTSPKATLRAYGHCRSEARATALLINVGDTDEVVAVDGIGGDYGVWVLTSDSITSGTVALNGTELGIQSGGLAALNGESKRAETHAVVTLPGRSIAFVSGDAVGAATGQCP